MDSIFNVGRIFFKRIISVVTLSRGGKNRVYEKSCVIWLVSLLLTIYISLGGGGNILIVATSTSDWWRFPYSHCALSTQSELSTYSALSSCTDLRQSDLGDPPHRHV